MTREVFVSGMARLALAFGVEADVPMAQLWWDAVQRLADDEWAAAVLRTVQVTVTTYGRFPAPGLLLQHAQPDLAPEATAAYERVLAAGEYGPESGTVWTFQRVKESCGQAAAEAFLEAGGNEAFRSEWGNDRRRERFLAAYQRTAREAPGTRLLPAVPGAKMLPGDAEPISRPQAKAVIEVLATLDADGKPRPKREPMSEAEWERRQEQLRQQAQALTGEGAA